MTEYRYEWRWRRTKLGWLSVALINRFGAPCRIFAMSARAGGPRNIGVEFMDGYRVACSLNAIRRRRFLIK